ncbi:alpha-E domain-containing protein [uncultured Serinicoccus sp.]|uniref:alpha-E domain-containing protein n=1 Tax=uncultured Serinicoccus sp. TaxID=735514 RepID=UPI00261405EF|nr:alpha-E domain-containing protein [uncultured Serinicoccus sp.]
MLSRIAESLFWIGRYLERAEDTSRLLEVHLTLLLEDPVVDEEATSEVLLRVMGIDGEASPDHQTVLQLLGWDETSMHSMVAAFYGARESARRSRETVALEMWEAINTTWNMMRGNRLQHVPANRACQLLRERCAVVGGIADNSMTHDEGWQYMMLGRSLERVDMTSRIIESAAYNADSPYAWTQTLRACGAHHAFIRTYRGAATDAQAAEFLLLDRMFPRSVLVSLQAAEEALASLEATTGGRRVGLTGEALRALGRARAELEFGSLEETMAHLPERMSRLQRTCSAVNDAVSDHYFDGAGASVWRAGVR